MTGAKLDNISSQVVIEQDAVLDLPNSEHRLLVESQNLGGQRDYSFGCSAAFHAEKRLYERRRALSPSAYLQVGNKLTLTGRTRLFGSQIHCRVYDGPIPTQESFIPYLSWVESLYWGHKKYDKAWWEHFNHCAVGTPITAIFSVGTGLQVITPHLAIAGIVSAPQIVFDGIEVGQLGLPVDLHIRLPAPKPYKAVHPLVDYMRDSSLFELTNPGTYPTVYQPILPSLSGPLGAIVVADSETRILRTNIHHYRCLFSPLQERELITRACIEGVGRGFLEPGLEPSQLLSILKGNAEAYAKSLTTALALKEENLQQPLVAYVEQDFEHELEQREKVLAPVLYLPKRYDIPETRDWAGGLFSSRGIRLQGSSQESSTLIITAHLNTQGEVVISNLDQLSQQRRVGKEKRYVTNTRTESRCFGLSEKTHYTQDELEVAIPQAGNTVKASGLKITDVTHLHQSGLKCETGAGGVQVKVEDLVQTPSIEVGIKPHYLKLGSTKTVTQEPHLIPRPNVICSQGSVSLEAERAHIYLNVNGQRAQDSSGPVKAQHLTFEQIEEQLAAAQRCREAMERDMRRTAKRKQTQGIVKMGVTTALTCYLGPQVGYALGASGLLTNSFAIAAAQGAVTGFVNSVIMEQNPIKGAVTGGVFGVFAKDNVIVRSLVNTAMHGGDPLKNIIKALETEEIAGLMSLILPFADQAVIQNLIQSMAAAAVRGGRPEDAWMALSEVLGKSLGTAIGDKVVARAQEVQQQRRDKAAGVRDEVLGIEDRSGPAQAKQSKAKHSSKEQYPESSCSSRSSRSGQRNRSTNPFRLGGEREVMDGLGPVYGSRASEERKVSSETDEMIALTLDRDTPVSFSLASPPLSKQVEPSRRKDLFFSSAAQYSGSGPKGGSTFGKGPKLSYLAEASGSKDSLVTNPSSVVAKHSASSRQDSDDRRDSRLRQKVESAEAESALSREFDQSSLSGVGPRNSRKHSSPGGAILGPHPDSVFFADGGQSGDNNLEKSSQTVEKPKKVSTTSPTASQQFRDLMMMTEALEDAFAGYSNLSPEEHAYRNRMRGEALAQSVTEAADILYDLGSILGNDPQCVPKYYEGQPPFSGVERPSKKIESFLADQGIDLHQAPPRNSMERLEVGSLKLASSMATGAGVAKLCSTGRKFLSTALKLAPARRVGSGLVPKKNFAEKLGRVETEFSQPKVGGRGLGSEMVHSGAPPKARLNAWEQFREGTGPTGSAVSNSRLGLGQQTRTGSTVAGESLISGMGRGPGLLPTSFPKAPCIPSKSQMPAVRPKTKGVPEQQIGKGLYHPEPLLSKELSKVMDWQRARNQYLKYTREWQMKPGVSELSNNTRDLLKKADNVVKNSMRPDDLAGMYKESRGIKIRGKGGEIVDHLREWNQGSKALKNAMVNVKKRLNELETAGKLEEVEARLLQEKLSELSKTKDLYTDLTREARCLIEANKLKR